MKKFFVLLFGLIFLLGGCSEKKIVRKNLRVPAERVMIKMEAKRRSVKTFSGKGTISVRTKFSDNKFNFLMKYKRPDSLYVAGFGPFGITIAEFILTDNSFEYYDDINNKVYRGEEPEKLIEKLFKINLTPIEFRSLLLGFANFNSDLRRKPFQYFDNEEDYDLIFIDSLKRKREYKIDKKKLILNKFEASSGKVGAMNLEIKYYDFLSIDFGKFDLPKRIKVVSEKPYSVLQIDYKEIEVNKKINSLKFMIPKDARTVNW